MPFRRLPESSPPRPLRLACPRDHARIAGRRPSRPPAPSCPGDANFRAKKRRMQPSWRRLPQQSPAATDAAAAASPCSAASAARPALLPECELLVAPHPAHALERAHAATERARPHGGPLRCSARPPAAARTVPLPAPCGGGPGPLHGDAQCTQNRAGGRARKRPAARTAGRRRRRQQSAGTRAVGVGVAGTGRGAVVQGRG